MEEQLKKRYETLTDRLNKLDTYHQQVTPAVAATLTDMSSRPAQYNPMERYKTLDTLTSQSAITKDLMDSQSNAADKYMAYEKAQKDEAYRQASLKNEQTRLAIEAAKSGRKVTIDPTTGAVTYQEQTPEEVLSGLSSKAKTDISNYTKFLKDTKDLQDLLEKAKLDSGVMTLGGVTGPLDQIKGQLIGSPAQKEFRAKLDAYRANIRKGLYGSVLTKQEIAEGNKFLPGNGAFESENNIRLASQFDDKMNALKARLQAEGLDAGTVETISGSLVPAGATASVTGPVMMRDPQGNPFTVDASEVDEAIKNGWTKQ